MVPIDKIMITKPISKIKAVATKDRIPLKHNKRANIEILENRKSQKANSFPANY